MTAFPEPVVAQPVAAPDACASFKEHGFHIARGLIPSAEITALGAHFTDLHRQAPIPEIYQTKPGSTDPLEVHPRMMQPHRWDRVARSYLLDARILATLGGLIGDEPLGVQSMFYFKPPGAAGQAFHQDNFYLMASPGTCYAAWLAIDDADAGNGSLYVLPGSQGRLIAAVASGTVDRWGNVVPQPDIGACTEVRLRAGDCLFFGGQLVHGSLRNTSTERWRRSFICHYIGRTGSRSVGAYYHPVLDGRGLLVEVAAGLKQPPGLEA